MSHQVIKSAHRIRTELKQVGLQLLFCFFQSKRIENSYLRHTKI